MNDRLEVLLVHPGGPYWANRDDGAWSLPKANARWTRIPFRLRSASSARSWGRPPSDRQPVFLGESRQPSGKRISVWALNGDVDVSVVRSNTFTMEWPPRSGDSKEFPEVDRAAWFDVDAARRKILPGQIDFIDRLFELLGSHHLS